jgi:Flp pilus assembly pilin Flp
MEKCEMRPSGERGQGILEYTLILVLVAMAVLLVLIIFGPELGNGFSLITRGL